MSPPAPGASSASATASSTRTPARCAPVRRMVDRWREIFAVLWRRKLRTVLTALSVSGGIFMLVVLLGAGNGLSQGATAEFARDATNAVWVEPEELSVPWKGKPVGTDVRFRNEDHELIRKALPIIDNASAMSRNGAASLTVRRGAK